MQLRSMTNDDLLAYKQLCSICYNQTDTSAVESLNENELHKRMGVFSDEGRLLSAMMQIPYDVRFCGQTVKYVGIGGVVTDPTARKGGAIRRMFEEGLPRLYHEGHVLSGLYPFSFRFYGKFGYTWIEAWRNRSIAVQDIRAELRMADEIVRVLPEEDDQGMREIYNAYIADKDIAFLRDDWMWKDLRRGTPWADMKHAYVMKVEGRPVAYWIGTVRKESEAILHISDMAWTCPRGREAIFAMFRGMNELGRVELAERGHFDLRTIAAEAYDVGESGSCPAMFRVVNAERALALLPAPPAAGQLTIEVTDGQIPENNGRITVVGDGEHVRIVKNSGDEADVVCDINGLSALVAGRQAFREAVANGVAQVMNERVMRYAEMLFAEKKLHMNQGF